MEKTVDNMLDRAVCAFQRTWLTIASDLGQLDREAGRTPKMRRREVMDVVSDYTYMYSQDPEAIAWYRSLGKTAQAKALKVVFPDAEYFF